MSASSSRGDVRGGLDDGDFGAHHAEEVAKLKADGPSAHDDEAFRDFGKVEDASAVEHGVAVEDEAEGRARRTTERIMLSVVNISSPVRSGRWPPLFRRTRRVLRTG